MDRFAGEKAEKREALMVVVDNAFDAWLCTVLPSADGCRDAAVVQDGKT
jgi:hypothetical protein